MPVTIIHDWDFAINRPQTSIKTAFWLLAEVLFGRFKWFQAKIPAYVRNIKYSHALALAEIDKLFGVQAIWGITDQVGKRYPNFMEYLERNDLPIHFHFHNPKSTQGKGVWLPSLQVTKENMIFDRRYCTKGDKTLPANGSNIVWHVDHPNNLSQYLLLLKRLKENNLL